MSVSYKICARKLAPVLRVRCELVRDLVTRSVCEFTNPNPEFLTDKHRLSPAGEASVRKMAEILYANDGKQKEEDRNRSLLALSGIKVLFVVTDNEAEAVKAGALWILGYNMVQRTMIQIAVSEMAPELAACDAQGDIETDEDAEGCAKKDMESPEVVFEIPSFLNEKTIRMVKIRLDKTVPEKGLDARSMMTALHVASMDGETFAYLDGLTEDALEEQMDQMELCPGLVKIVRVPAVLASHPRIRHLLQLYPEACLMIRPDKIGIDYYMSFCGKLLAEGKAKFKDEQQMRIAIQKMMQIEGDDLTEELVGAYLDQGLEGRHFDLEKMFADPSGAADMQRPTSERLQKLPGLSEFKKAAEQMCALVREQGRNDKLTVHRNMIFAGNPGCGKTMCGLLLAQLLMQEGITKPVFIMPPRSDLVAGYVGQTAPLVRKAFERARGGVLFVDEAGFFLNRSSGGFVDEAIREFVRYMEMYPDVTVIFAMYTSEVQDFLELDPGLRSRISRVVRFQDYSAEELYEITAHILKENGYTLRGGKADLLAYYETERKKENFGNARGARKVAEALILSLCMAKMAVGQEGQRGNAPMKDAASSADLRIQNSRLITARIVADTVTRLRAENEERKATVAMGFLKSAMEGDGRNAGLLKAACK